MPRDVVFVVYPGIQGLDLDGPLEVFAAANDGAGRAEYRLTVAATTPDWVRTSSGLRIGVDRRLAEIRGRVDTLVVAGGQGTAEAYVDAELIGQIQRLAPRSRRVTSVCSGAFLLAAAGLLDGRRATTHWSVCDTMAAAHPEVAVDPDPIFVRDGNVYTSAGVTAGIDLALALVEEDLGPGVALAVARHLVLFLRRPANQAQFSAPLAGQLAGTDVVRGVQQYAIEHPGAELTVAALARRAAMSERHFARLFGEQVGMTPAKFVERVRVDTARRLLEDGAAAVEDIARECGFGTPDTMRRVFLRALGVTPTEYRRRFRAA
jgi:transcriptional regulator GlxA family with amidase domain